MVAAGPIAKLVWAGLMLLLGAVDDIRSRKVHNRLIAGIFISSLIVVIIVDGKIGLLDSLFSILTAFISVLPLYLLKALGGGDVKLFTAVAPLLNWKAVLVMLLASLVWGALLGLFQVLLKGQGKALLQNMLGIFLRNKPPEQNLHKIPYTIALLFGFLTSLKIAGEL